MKKGGPNDVAGLICVASVARKRVADLPASCSWSSRRARHDVGCGREDGTVHRSLLSASGGDREVRATHLTSTSQCAYFVFDGWFACKQ